MTAYVPCGSNDLGYELYHKQIIRYIQKNDLRTNLKAFSEKTCVRSYAATPLEIIGEPYCPDDGCKQECDGWYNDQADGKVRHRLASSGT